MTKKAKVLEDSGYNVIVTGRHVAVTDAMKSYALDKLSKLDKFHDRIIDVNVTMDRQRADHKIDIRMKVNNISVSSHAVTDDMYASIDQAVHKLQTQLRRYKSRIQDHQTHAGKVVQMAVKVVRAPGEAIVQEVNDEIEEENQRSMDVALRPHPVVASETLPLKDLNTEEAVMKMELSGDVFLIYRDEADRHIKVIYRRSDGNYGIIQTEA